ncbi:hydrolase, haloacid dehalogenase-like family [Aquipluma nitroreducens]|uniref:Hydrolase, haloacid dehalogenase-like family n=1 Tax=Aquipluma nitroreducens TaxID=2010828 RepID=A0A5K7SD41_9BACT|nr:HAD family phosphatase [Aquipluma nitroreducens]BBE19521.1 hydrolase, haloacid dehalogenase-like family [Aquipluma nitroreducens]
MIEAIIFDMDGTLVDTEPFNTEIERRQFALNKIVISEEDHQKFLGVASDAMWKEIAEQYNLQILVEELIEQNHIESIRYFTGIEEILVMPGLVELLEKLQAKKYPMAVASSSTPEIIDLILNKTDLKKYFQVIASAEQAGKSKPEPDVFLLTAERLGIKPANCLVVEDSSNGIKAAQAAGMTCVAYHSPDADPQKQKEADAVIQNYSQLGIMHF